MGEETPESSPDHGEVLKTLYFEPAPVFDPEEPRLPTVHDFEMSNAAKGAIAKKQVPITIEPTGSPQDAAGATAVTQVTQATGGATQALNVQVPPPTEAVIAQEQRLFAALQLQLGRHLPAESIRDWMHQQEHIHLPLPDEQVQEIIRTRGRGNRTTTAAAATTTTTTTAQSAQVVQQTPVTTSAATSVATAAVQQAGNPPADWQSQMNNLLTAQHNLAAQISVLVANYDQNQQRWLNTEQTANDAWNTANVHTLGLKVPGLYKLPPRTSTQDPGPPPQKNYFARLPPYNAQKETFRAYLSRYENYCESNALNETARKQELVSTAAGAVDRITMRKPLVEWNLAELLQECKDRLCDHWTTAQLEQALYTLTVESSDDPETIMRKVEDILEKADIDRVPQWQLELLQCEHFMRLIHVHVPMHTYVRRRLGANINPKTALAVAKEYLRDKGDENVYITDLIKKQLQVQPQNLTSATPQPWTPFSYVPQPGVPEKKGLNVGLAGIPPKAVAAHYQPVIQQDNEPVADYMRRFLAANEEVSKEELIRRLNDCERLKRDLHQAGIPDKFKKSGQSDYDNSVDRGRGRGRGYPPRQQTQTQKPGFQKDDRDFTPRKTFDKNGKPKRFDNKFRGKPSDKRYRKVETEVNGKIQSHFVTDDEEEPEVYEEQPPYEDESSE